MNVLELEDIVLVRGGRTILDGVTWRIARGEHSVLLGANGSGKTTLLKVLTGYEWPTSGRVRVLGQEYGGCDIRALRRHIGWVSSAMEHRVPPEDDAMRVVASGFDASFGVYRPIAVGEQERCRVALEALNIGRLATQAFGLMSQGEQKRTLIARALVHDPALLVLDEPCAGLDPVSRRDFLHEIGEFTRRANVPTVILVTHHVEEIQSWLRSAMALRAGRALHAGSLRNVMRSEVISEVFGRPCRLTQSGMEFHLSLD